MKPQKPEIQTVKYDRIVFGRGSSPATSVYIEKNAEVSFARYTLKLVIKVKTDESSYDFVVTRTHDRKPFQWNRWGVYPTPCDPASFINGKYDPSLLIEQIESGQFNPHYLRGHKLEF